MRLFELARELKTSNRDLLRQAKHLDIEANSFIYPLDAAEEVALRQGYKARTSIDVADDEANMNRLLDAKRQAAAYAHAKILAKESQALTDAAARARQALLDEKIRRQNQPPAPPPPPPAPVEAPAPVKTSAPVAIESEKAVAPEKPSKIKTSSEKVEKVAKADKSGTAQSAKTVAPAKPTASAKASSNAKTVASAKASTATKATTASQKAVPASKKTTPPPKRTAPLPPPKPFVIDSLPERPLQAPRPEIKLESLPQRPLQAPRPEVVAKKPAVATAQSSASATPSKATKPTPAASAAATKPAPAHPNAAVSATHPNAAASAAHPNAATPTKKADLPKNPKKDKKPPRPLHPIDEEDEDSPYYGNLGKASRMGNSNRSNPSRRENERNGLRDPRQKNGYGANATKPATPVAVAATPTGSEQSHVIKIHGTVAVKDLAEKLGTRPNLVIASLMKLGILASINQSVEAETASKIAAQFGYTVEVEKQRRSSENRPVIKSENADDEIPEDRPDQLLPRPPVVTFLGHVDHGKTSLMDRIRKANVAAGEAGGITQHISAYTVDVNGQKITFLDTPGHAAFSAMRARGATLTDIAVIIIAADDGIMPQTKEAIKHARSAGVTIMVAINKCDLPTANVMRVMQQLQGEKLTPEEWGGDTVVCQVSAVTGDGIGNLLDMILLQSEVLELTANPNRRANGTIVEAQMQPGSGPIASALITGGTLKVGDVVLCGEHYGKLRAIIDSQGHRVKSVGPSGAARLMGLSGVPEAGAEFRVMTSEKRARELAGAYAQQKKEEILGGVTQARSADDIFRKLHEAEKLELNIILRADVQGSVEAVQESIEQIKSEKVACNIIQSSTGSITSNDVQRAGSGKAIIVGFNVSPDSGVNSEARHFGVKISTFRIIYELLEYVKQEMLDLIPVEYREVVKGHAEVKQLFTLNHVGVAAGSLVTDGTITTEGKARVIRHKKVVHTGPFTSIRHFKEEVKQVTQAQECGILLTDFEAFQEGDVIECFVFEELPKSL